MPRNSQGRRPVVVSTRTGLILIGLAVAGGAAIVTLWPYKGLDPATTQLEEARSASSVELIAVSGSKPANARALGTHQRR